MLDVRMRERSALLGQAVRALASASHDPREVLETLAQQVAVALDAVCGFMRIADDQLVAVAHAAPGPDGADFAAVVVKPTIPLACDTLAARALREDRTIHVAEVSDLQAAARYVDPADLARARAYAPGPGLFVPVRAAERVVGVMVLLRRRGAEPFVDDDVEFAEQLADLGALAQQSSRLVDEPRERATRLQLLSQLSREFERAADSYQHLLDVIARRIGETLADSCAIRLLRGDDDGFASHVAVYNRDAGLALRHAEMLRGLGTRITEGLVSRALAEGATIRIPVVDLPALIAQSAPFARGVLTELAPATFMVVPITNHDAAVAVMMMSRGPDAPAFTAEDQQLADGLAAHAAIAIVNAQLIERSTRTAKRLHLLTEASAAFAGDVDDPHRILHTVAQRLNELIGGLCVIDLAGDAPDLAADERVIQLPLRAGSQVLGTLTLSRSTGSYTEDDRRFAQELVTHAALAIRNSRLLAEVQRELAERARAETALRESAERLRHAQKMEAIGRLAGGVAHDFNNLLSVVLSSCDFIVDAEPDGGVLRDVAQIRRAGERAADLTRQLLAFSRQQAIEPQVLDLNAQIEQMRGMLARVIGETVALDLRLAPGLGSVIADATHIEQVLMNLVINGRDAMPAGGTLAIATERVELDDAEARRLDVRAGSYLMTTVSDTGEGMPPEALERIFEPFYTTKPRGKGTGLGLSTVFGIVTQNGGAIRTRSELGRGTTFEVLLPRSDRVPTDRMPALPRAASGGGETILLAEDEDGVRRTVVEILTRSGYRVIETANGRDALEAFERHADIDLVLTDVVMPVMSGGELVSRLRAKRPGLKVLYMSGYPDDAYLRQHPLEKGSPLLQKPLQPDPVLRKVREVLGS